MASATTEDTEINFVHTWMHEKSCLFKNDVKTSEKKLICIFIPSYMSYFYNNVNFFIICCHKKSKNNILK